MTRRGTAAVLALALCAASAALGCGAAQKADPEIEPRVVIEGTSILIVDDANEQLPLEVPFEVDSHELTGTSHEILGVLADFLQANAELTLIEVQGHSDERGTPEYNQSLSTRRAKSVVDYLVSRGVDQARLRPRGFGASRPAARGKDESAWRQNRRVEFVIVSTSR